MSAACTYFMQSSELNCGLDCVAQIVTGVRYWPPQCLRCSLGCVAWWLMLEHWRVQLCIFHKDGPQVFSGEMLVIMAIRRENIVLSLESPAGSIVVHSDLCRFLPLTTLKTGATCHLAFISSNDILTSSKSFLQIWSWNRSICLDHYLANVSF